VRQVGIGGGGADGARRRECGVGRGFFLGMFRFILLSNFFGYIYLWRYWSVSIQHWLLMADGKWHDLVPIGFIHCALVLLGLNLNSVIRSISRRWSDGFGYVGVSEESERGVGAQSCCLVGALEGGGGGGVRGRARQGRAGGWWCLWWV